MEQLDQISENEPLSPTHAAMGIFVILKHILRNLFDSQLLQTRLVNRHWNFAATSELVIRKHAILPIKLYTFSSNQIQDRDYRWYIEFENSRRLLWNDLYGADPPILEFSHLQFSNPQETNDDFIRILQFPWMPSITSLTLSMCESSCEKFLTSFFLPSFANLRSLVCFMEPESNFGNLYSELSADLTLTPDTSSSDTSTQPTCIVAKKPCCYSTLKSVIIWFQQPCKFPWSLLEAFPQLENLQLHFADAVSLIQSSQDLVSEILPTEIQNVDISIIQKPSLSSLKTQVADPGFTTEAFATATANLCNHLLAQQKLSVLTMLPASYGFSFLKKLNATNVTQFELQVAAPCNYAQFQTQTAFPGFLIAEISIKFPCLTHLQLQFLQHQSDATFTIVGIPILANPRRNLSSSTLEKLQISTQATDLQEGSYALLSIYGAELMRFTTGLENLSEVVFQVCTWDDCAAIIATLRNHPVKKLILRATSSAISVWIASWVFFPGILDEFPSNWFYSNDVGLTYKGLPGIETIQELGLELVGVVYDPAVEREFSQAASLKSIFLDARCNEVDDGKVSQEQPDLQDLDPEIYYFWPSSVTGVSIVAV